MTIEERLSTLEKEVKRTKRLNRYLLGAALLVATIGLIGAAPLHQLKEIRANSFILEDETGNTRANLCMKDGEPRLVFLDENAKEIIRLSVDSMKPLGVDVNSSHLYLCENDKNMVMLSSSRMLIQDQGGEIIWEEPTTKKTFDEIRAKKIVLEDENGTNRAGLFMTNEGPNLVMTDDNGNLRVVLAEFKKGPGLSFLDGNGQTIESLTTYDDRPSLSQYEKNGKRNAMLTLIKDKGSMLELSDGNGLDRVQLNAFSVGPELVLFDENHTNRVALGTIKEPFLTLLDEKGNIFWATPSKTGE